MRSPTFRTPEARRQRRRVRTPMSARRAVSFPIIKTSDFEFSISQPAAHRDVPVVMPFRTATNGGIRAFGGGKPSNYSRGQTHRQTEEHGDLNTYNRVYQFYNYHADKDILLDEMCRGLVLSSLRIAGGTCEDYTTPLAWPCPYVINRQDASHHALLSFHFKDNRRHSPTFGKTISTYNANWGSVMGSSTRVLPAQYDAEVWASEASGFPTSSVLLYHPTTGLMKSLKEVAADLATMFKQWIAFTQTFETTVPNPSVPKGLDLVPCRMQLIKSSLHNDEAGIVTDSAYHSKAFCVEFDDREFGSSTVDVTARTTIKLQNVTPASGNVLLTSDPMGSDNITHVPLKGKIYSFSGPVPKVWDRHRGDLQNMFHPESFKLGRYLLPNSKLHESTTEEFRTPPRGRFIWSNCMDEQRITMAPGSMHDIKLNYRVKTSIKDFWYKYRDDDLSSSKLGKSICLCLEPAIRRSHVGTPIKKVLVKEQLVANEGGYFGPEVRKVPVEYEPYEWVTDSSGLTQKKTRQVFTFGSTVYPSTGIGPPGNLGSDPRSLTPGTVTVNKWYRSSTITQTATVSNAYPSAAPQSNPPLMWDDIKEIDTVSHPALRGFVSRGDPLMFNVQINRTYGASARLTNFTRLGSDKSGVKRKYDEKMFSNMGDFNADGVVNKLDWEAARLKGDVYADHELETATQAGVRQLVLEGDIQNTAVTSDVNVIVQGGATQAQFQTAMENAIESKMDSDGQKAGVQFDVSQLDSVLNNGKLSVSDSAVLNHTQLQNAFATALGAKAGVIGHAVEAAKSHDLAMIVVGGTSMSASAVKDYLMFELGVTGVYLQAVEALMATGSFALSALEAAAGLIIGSDALIAAHQTKDVNVVNHAQISPTVNVATTNTTVDNTTTQNITVGATAQQIASAIGTQELTVKNVAGQSLSVTGAVQVSTAAGTGLAVKNVQGSSIDVTGFGPDDTVKVSTVAQYPLHVDGAPVKVMNQVGTILGVEENNPLTSIDVNITNPLSDPRLHGFIQDHSGSNIGSSGGLWDIHDAQGTKYVGVQIRDGDQIIVCSHDTINKYRGRLVRRPALSSSSWHVDVVFDVNVTNPVTTGVVTGRSTSTVNHNVYNIMTDVGVYITQQFLYLGEYNVSGQNSNTYAGYRVQKTVGVNNWILIDAGV